MGASSLIPLRAAFARGTYRGRRPTIVIDPGHGGVDPGAIGHGGLEEKHVVLDIAHRCASDLAYLTGARVHMTRHSDVFLPLARRVEIARAYNANLFVSIHADSAPSPEARGLSIYTLSEHASDRLAASLARHANSVDRTYGIKLKHYNHAVRSILMDMARRETLSLSCDVQHNLLRDLGRNVRLLDRPARRANFEVLRSPVPAVLIESGFLSNRHDEHELRSSRYRRRLGTRMAHAIRDSLATVVDV